ncbi:MAG: glycosyltransferase [Nitriliruptoraceae bacterium]|nr:glycosyltransferase [Nitriliruptoraceae bacterium]
MSVTHRSPLPPEQGPVTPSSASADDPVRAPARHWWYREPVVQALVLVAVAIGLAYLTWRVMATSTGTNPIAFWALWAAEAYGVVALGLNALQGWRVPPPPGPRPPTSTVPSVDVFVCTYDEAAEVVEATLAGAAAIRYPDVEVHLLDDGRREHMRELAALYGATYRVRGDNRHAKAGNINAALEATAADAADLVLVLDADHVPDPDILLHTVGYFDDPEVAVVQTPHEFVNLDSFQHVPMTDIHEQSLFYRVLMPGRDRHDAAFWCGSAAVLRREALTAVGGVATETITEDYHTTLKMIAHGYVARVHDRALVRGLAPDTLEAFLVQRGRWATGNLATLRTPDGPLRNPALRPLQRLHFLATGVWFLSGLQRLVFWAVIAAALWAGVVPAAIGLREFAIIWAAQIVVSTLAGTALGRGHLRHRDALRWQVLTTAAYSWAVLASLLPGATTFKVTPKVNGTSSAAALLRHAKLPLLIGVVLLAGLGVRLGEQLAERTVLPALPPVALGVVAVFACLEIAMIGTALVSVGRRRQHRAAFRVPTSLRAHVDGRAATVTDLSQHGLRLVGDGAPPVAGDQVAVTILLPDPQGDPQAVDLKAVIRNVAERHGGPGWSAGASLGTLDPEIRAAIAIFIHVTSFRSIDQPADPGLPSVGVPVSG